MEKKYKKIKTFVYIIGISFLVLFFGLLILSFFDKDKRELIEYMKMWNISSEESQKIKNGIDVQAQSMGKKMDTELTIEERGQMRESLGIENTETFTDEDLMYEEEYMYYGNDYDIDGYDEEFNTYEELK
ncbi:MAG: hypothetical protein EOM19_01080 [Candidatus Moranbacteria bacterium]|nr:hypothetical protein [Candidatus Moranbacteria bacterium]